jgi:hypothetical protein
MESEAAGGAAGVARYDWYILRIWRSGGRRPGEQWAARLESMPDGASRRFNRPDLLLEHLEALISPVGDAGFGAAPEETRAGESGQHTTELS